MSWWQAALNSAVSIGKEAVADGIQSTVAEVFHTAAASTSSQTAELHSLDLLAVKLASLAYSAETVDHRAIGLAEISEQVERANQRRGGGGERGSARGDGNSTTKLVGPYETALQLEPVNAEWFNPPILDVCDTFESPEGEQKLEAAKKKQPKAEW